MQDEDSEIELVVPVEENDVDSIALGKTIWNEITAGVGIWGAFRPVFAVSPRRRVMADVSPAHLHLVFSAECIPAFDWQSAGLFYSFNRTRQLGKITRLLACSDEQLASYPKSNLDMGPTFVHLNMRFDAVNDIERGDPFHDDKAGHGCPPPPSNSKAFFPVTHMRSAAAAQTPATTSHSPSWRGLSRSTLRRTLCS